MSAEKSRIQEKKLVPIRTILRWLFRSGLRSRLRLRCCKSERRIGPKLCSRRQEDQKPLLDQ